MYIPLMVMAACALFGNPTMYLLLPGGIQMKPSNAHTLISTCVCVQLHLYKAFA